MAKAVYDKYKVLYKTLQIKVASPKKIMIEALCKRIIMNEVNLKWFRPIYDLIRIFPGTNIKKKTNFCNTTLEHLNYALLNF